MGCLRVVIYFLAMSWSALVSVILRRRGCRGQAAEEVWWSGRCWQVVDSAVTPDLALTPSLPPSADLGATVKRDDVYKRSTFRGNLTRGYKIVKHINLSPLVSHI